METTSLSIIPIEVIERILCFENLTFIDVCRFGSTSSRHWNLVSTSNFLWKTKFQQNWPRLMALGHYKNRSVENWRNEFCNRLHFGRQTMALVKGMLPKHFKREELSYSDFALFEQLCNEAEFNTELAMDFMIDELMKCIHHENRNTNLTAKYYGEKVLAHLRHIEVSRRWEQFCNTAPECQLLEHGAVLVAQWSQPALDITDQDIGLQLDKIAEKVLAEIRQKYGDAHLALHVPREEREKWRTHNIPDNFYKPNVSRQVVEAVSKVLFQDLGFFGNSELYYCHENSYINKVLELGRGIPITLSIVYESVTRRLGIKCEPVSFPGHFLLRWRDTYMSDVPAQFFYIDVFNGGVFLGRDSCPQFAGAARCPMSDVFRFGPATPIQVIQRMANNLEMAGRQRSLMNGRNARLQCALELQLLVSPDNFHCLQQLSRFYMQYNMDTSHLQRAIERRTHYDVRDMGQVAYLLRTLQEYSQEHANRVRNYNQNVTARRRKKRPDLTSEVEFAVGLVMQHLRYGYTCVIFGWDPLCVATQEWKNQMNIGSLSRKDQQPFYHVLVNDGTTRYAAQENLMVLNTSSNSNSQQVGHCEVGRYFDTFTGVYYKMNQQMQRVYPDEAPVLKEKTK